MQLYTTHDDAGSRLDVWLEHELDGLSRSRIQALLKAGDIRVDGHAAKPHQKVAPGWTVDITIPPPAPAGPLPEAIPIEALYEDTDIIVLNKPAGLVVHPAAGHPSGTLVNALLHHCRDLQGIGGELRPGIVHRLDRDTSGAMVVAKNQTAMESLVSQFKKGLVRKEYIALVLGVPRKGCGTVETLIGRSRHDRKKMSADPPVGREAVTHYELVEAWSEAAYLRVVIETGRTHQIRVHLAHIGFPVIGDRVYGRRNPAIAAPRQMLHAARLGFIHPRSREALAFEAPLPRDMASLIDQLRGPIPKGGTVRPKPLLCVPRCPNNG